jgi:hypothetical protein
MQIEITDQFWTNAILTAYELFRYPDDTGKIICAECLGGVWGDRDGDIYRARFATTTQLIEKRDEASVVGPDPFEHLIHNAWAALDVADANYLGGFHSHPWTEQEVKDYLASGETDDVFWQPSDADKDSMPHKCIEIIVSLRPTTTVDPNLFTWAERGQLVSGKIDIAHITFSGWFMDDNGGFSQVPIRAGFLSAVNARIAEIDRRSQSAPPTC